MRQCCWLRWKLTRPILPNLKVLCYRWVMFAACAQSLIFYASDACALWIFAHMCSTSYHMWFIIANARTMQDVDNVLAKDDHPKKLSLLYKRCCLTHWTRQYVHLKLRCPFKWKRKNKNNKQQLRNLYNEFKEHYVLDTRASTMINRARLPNMDHNAVLQ